MKNKIFLMLLLCGAIFGVTSCGDFLDETPDKSGSAYIYHMDQLYGLNGNIDLYMGNSPYTNASINGGQAESYLVESFFMSDAIEITPEYFINGGLSMLNNLQYDLYCLNKNEYKSGILIQRLTWNPAWDRIYRFNTVLENVDKVIQTTEAIRNQVEGEARFGRAYYHFLLLTQYCQWKEDAPGIGYREDTDPKGIPERKTVGYTVSRIYEDLQVAEELLKRAGRTDFDFKRHTRPTVPTVRAFRARVDLYRGNYTSALENANAALAAHHELVDLNTDSYSQVNDYMPLVYLDENGNPGNVRMSKVPLMLQALKGQAFLEYREMFLPSWSMFMFYGAMIPVSTSFYNLWEDKENDLRWTNFYNSCMSVFYIPEVLGTGGNISYACQQWLRPADYHTYWRFVAGMVGQILGMTTAEMYLTKAECMARTGAPAAEVAEVLKALRRTRFADPDAADNIGGTLQDVLDERYREMGAFWRFFEIKRLNGAENAGITLRREILTDPTDLNSRTTIEVAADDPRWALPIFGTECDLMGWEQNAGWE